MTDNEKVPGAPATRAKDKTLLDAMRGDGDALKLKGLDGSALWVRADAIVYVRTTPSADPETPGVLVTHVGTLAGVVVVVDDAADVAKALEF